MADAQLVFNITGRDEGVSGAFDQIAARAEAMGAATKLAGSDASAGMDQAAGSSKKLADSHAAMEIAANRVRLAEMALDEVNKNADATDRQKLTAQTSLLAARQAMTHAEEGVAKAAADAGKATEEGMVKADKSAKDAANGINISATQIVGSFNTINNVVGGVTPSVSGGVLKMTGAMGLLGAGAAASSALTGAALGGLPLVFAGVAAMMVKTAVASSASLQQTFSQAGDSIKSTMLDAAAPMVQMFVSVAQDAADAFKQMGPALHDAFASSAPLIGTLSSGLLAMVQNILPGMNDGLRAAAAPMAALASGLATLGSDLGAFFTNLSAGAAGGAVGLSALFNLVGGLLPLLGQFLAAISGPASAAMQELAHFVLSLVAALLGGLQPVLGALLPVFGQLLQSLEPLLPAISQLVAAFAPVITSVGGALIPVVKQLVDVFVKLMPSITPLIGPLVNLMDPIVSMIDPIAKLAVSFGQALLPVIGKIIPVLQDLQDQLSGGLGNDLLDIGNAVIPLIKPLGDLAVTLGQALVGALKVVMPPLTELVNAGFKGIVEAIKPVIPILGQALVSALKIVAPLLGDLLKAVTPLIKPIADLGGQLLKVLAEVLVKVLDAVKPLVQPIIGVVQAIAPFLPQVAQMISQLLPPLVTLLMKLLDAFRPLIKPIADLVVQLTPFIAQLLQLATYVLSEVVRGLVDFLDKAVIPVVTWLVDHLVPAIQKAGDFFTDLWQNHVVPVWQGISSAVQTGIDNVVNAIRTCIDNVTSAWNNGWNGIKDFLGTVWNGIVDGVRTGIDNAVNVVSGIQGRILDALAGAGSWLSDIGGQIIGGLISGIQGALGGLGDVLGNVTSFIASHKGPESVDRVLLKPHGGWIMGGLMQGMEDSLPALQGTLDKVTRTLAVPSLGSGTLASSPAAVPPAPARGNWSGTSTSTAANSSAWSEEKSAGESTTPTSGQERGPADDQQRTGADHAEEQRAGRDPGRRAPAGGHRPGLRPRPPPRDRPRRGLRPRRGPARLARHPARGRDGAGPAAQGPPARQIPLDRRQRHPTTPQAAGRWGPMAGCLLSVPPAPTGRAPGSLRGPFRAVRGSVLVPAQEDRAACPLGAQGHGRRTAHGSLAGRPGDLRRHPELVGQLEELGHRDLHGIRGVGWIEHSDRFLRFRSDRAMAILVLCGASRLRNPPSDDFVRRLSRVRQHRPWTMSRTRSLTDSVEEPNHRLQSSETSD